MLFDSKITKSILKGEFIATRQILSSFTGNFGVWLAKGQFLIKDFMHSCIFGWLVGWLVSFTAYQILFYYFMMKSI